MRSGFLSLRPGLRAKILLLTALTPAVLAAAVLLTVHRNVRSHVNSTSIHENLEHSATVFENMLAVRLRALSGGAQVIARDPRFFSLVMLGPAQRDPHFLATVKGTANDFNRITQTDLFEVFDRRGRVLAAVGPKTTQRSARENLVKEALQGANVARVMAQGEEHFQVAVVPVRADGQIVGALLLGAVIGPALARELKSQMRSEVTFLSNGKVTGTTLVLDEDLGALRGWLAGIDTSPEQLVAAGVRKMTAGRQIYLTLVRPIPNAAAGSAQLYVMQRSHDPESSFLKSMQSDMLKLGGLAVLLALIAGWLFSRQITGPVLALVEGARAMEDGDFEREIRIRNRDEIGYLAERFQVMRERERAYVESLREAARVKSEFISIASHELRTPISVIQGYRDLLSEGTLGEVTPRQQQALHAIRDSLTLLTKVAEDATQVAQIEGERVQLEPAETALVPLVEKSIVLAKAAAPGRKIEVTADLAPNLGGAWIDAGRFTETLSHLIGNGIRYTPDGGQVVVRGRCDRDFVVLQVRDTGTGIAADRLDQLFGRGLVLREAAHHKSSTGLDFNSAGLGFGLAFVRAIVEAHGGTIDAASEPGVGTTMTVRVPRRPVASALAA